jgi:lipopolysaccharide export system permease protein
LESSAGAGSGSGRGARDWPPSLRPDRGATIGKRVPVQLAKTFSAYIARQFLVWFCGVFAAMLVVTFLLEYLELIRRGGARMQATLSLLLEMAALKLPHTAQEVMPFAVLFGTMLAFWRLTRSNELVVARAAGVSVWQFLTPAVLVALLLGILAVTVFNPIASSMEASYEKLEGRILREGADELSLSRAGLWLRQSDAAGNQIIIHADKLAPQALVLEGVHLFFFNGLLQFTSRIDARSATLDDQAWLIEDGSRWLPDRPPEPFAELRLPTRLTPRKIEESFASPDTMSFWELPGFISLLEQSGFSAQRHRLHFDVLLARPFLFCAMVLVAATFSLRMHRRGGATLMIVGGVVSGFLLYFLSDVVFALGLSDKVPVTLAAWTPTGVSLTFGISMLLHLEDG